MLQGQQGLYNGRTKRQHLDDFDVNVNWHSHYRKRHGVSSEKLKLELPYDPAILLLGI